MAEPTDISPLSQLMRRIDARDVDTPAVDTVSTGFPSVDQLLGGGVRGGDLVVLGGDIGSGKSAFALAVALRGALAGASVAFYTGEMTVERVLERMLALEGRARIDELRRGGLDEFTRASVGAAVLRLREVSPVVERMPAGVDALIESVRARSGVRLVVVDSLQGLATGRTTLDEELAAAVRLLKTLAVDLSVGVLLLAQLPALPPAGARPDRRPTLDDFGVMHAVKQHADVILGLYREEMYQNSQSADGATELLALKNRGGPTGYVDLYFFKQWLRFEDLIERS